MIEPIRPNEVTDVKKATIPDEVIIAFNQLIIENWKKDSSSRFLQKKVIRMIQQRLGAGVLSGEDIIDNGYLDVEDIFRKAGWDVEYDGPGYNETYEASFTFSKKKKKNK